MIFLIEYVRAERRLVRMTPFEDFERLEAERARLDLEIELYRLQQDHEIVLLQAPSEEALRRTHRRYFETASQLATSSSSAGTTEGGDRKRCR